MSRQIIAGRISPPLANIRLQTRTTNNSPSPLVGDILDPTNLKPTAKVKLTSAISHFNTYLSLRNEQLVKDNEECGQSNLDELTFEDLDTGNYVSGFAYYLAKTARRYKKADGIPLSYASATGYMSSIKSSLITKFRFDSCTPKQISPDIWKRYMTQIFCIK